MLCSDAESLLKTRLPVEAHSFVSVSVFNFKMPYEGVQAVTLGVFLPCLRNEKWKKIRKLLKFDSGKHTFTK